MNREERTAHYRQERMNAPRQLKAMHRLETAVRLRRLWVKSHIKSSGQVLVYTECGAISVHNDGSFHRAGA